MATSSEETRNLDVVRRAYEAFQAGDAEALMKCFAPNIHYQLAPFGKFTGDYRGIPAVMEFFGQIAQEFGRDLSGDALGYGGKRQSRIRAPKSYRQAGRKDVRRYRRIGFHVGWRRDHGGDVLRERLSGCSRLLVVVVEASRPPKNKDGRVSQGPTGISPPTKTGPDGLPFGAPPGGSSVTA